MVASQWRVNSLVPLVFNRCVFMSFQRMSFYVCLTVLTSHGVLEANEWRPLLTESLDGWEVYTGIPHKSVSVPGYPQSESEDSRNGMAIGLGDPLKIFQIEDLDGTPVLHISGQVYAGLTSLEEFEDYHLSMEFKWGELKWPPRLNARRDSGVLVHCTGQHGAFWNVWMRSLECQVQETDSGDFIALAGVSARIPVDSADNSRPRYIADGHERSVGAGTSAWGTQRTQNFERPDGWNRVDIMTVGDECLFAVNGQVVMRLRDTKVGNPSDGRPLVRGRIQIQSEAAEAFYRNIRIRTISEVPQTEMIELN